MLEKVNDKKLGCEDTIYAIKCRQVANNSYFNF